MAFFSRRKRFISRGETYSDIVSVNSVLDKSSVVTSENTLRLLCELISDESDAHVKAAYCIFYIGYYKPFSNCNEETAKEYARKILMNQNKSFSESKYCNECFLEQCNGRHTVEEIAAWLRA